MKERIYIVSLDEFKHHYDCERYENVVEQLKVTDEKSVAAMCKASGDYISKQSPYTLAEFTEEFNYAVLDTISSELHLLRVFGGRRRKRARRL